MKISLEQFIENTKGKQIDVPFPTKINLKGQCVSLIQQYISQCLNQEAKPRGNASNWIHTYVEEGLGSIVDHLKKGDLLVFKEESFGLGHIAIYVKDNIIYDQNNLRHDHGLSGYGTIFTNDYVILRPNEELYEDIDLLDLVRKTIRGDFGNGEERKRILKENYEEVQRQVNMNLKNNITNWDDIQLY